MVAIAVTPPFTSGDLSNTGSLASCEGEGIITAVKPALRGEGTIVRALVDGVMTLHLPPGHQVMRCDASERDLAPIGQSGDLTLDRAKDGSIVTLRVR